MKEKKITFEWHSVARDIVRNVWVIFCAMLIGLMGSYIVTHSLYLPEYTSSASLIINSAQGKSNAVASLKQSSEIANIYSEVFSQPTMEEKVCEYLNISRFDGKIHTFVNDGTNIMEISVVSSNPLTSYKEVSAILKVYPMLTSSLFDNGAVSILKTPYISSSPSNSMTSMNYIKVMLICAVAAFLMIVVLSMIRDTVKNSNSFNSSIDSKLIGVIPHERKTKGIKEYLSSNKKGLLMYENAYTSLKFAENFNKIATKIEYMNKTQGDKVFAVTSVAENEGKSTVSANIAIALSTKGYNVLIVDFDAKKPALYKLFNEESRENSELADLLSGTISENEFKYRQYKNKTLYLALNTSSHKEYHDWLETGSAKEFINKAKEKVDYIIIDTAPLSVDVSVTDIAKMCDSTFVVVRTDSSYISIINDSILTLKKTGATVAGCILNDEFEEISLFGQLGIDEYGYQSYHRYGYGKYGYGKYNYGKYGYGKYNYGRNNYSYGKYGYGDRKNHYAKQTSNYSSYAGYGGYESSHANPSIVPENITMNDIDVFDIKENDNGGNV